MKTSLANSQNNALRFSSPFRILVGLAILLGTAQGAMAQTIDIGPNQYAFRFTNNPNYGLFFNAASTQYEFRNGTATPIFAISADNGRMNTNLEFNPGSDLLVGANRYAFRSSVAPNVGLYATNNRIQFLNPSATPIFSINTSDGKFDTDLEFNSGKSLKVAAGNFAVRSATIPNAGIFFGASDYEFRNSAGTPVFRVNSSNGNVVSNGTVQASGGNSTNWNQAHAWGNHATAGYISSESDPKVAAMSTSQVPRWSGSQLVASTITADAASVNINSTASVPLLALNSTSASANPLFSLRRNGAQTAYIQSFGSDFYLTNQLSGSLFLSTNNTTRMSINSTGQVGINTAPVPNSELKVSTAGTGQAIEATVTYEGAVDVEGVLANSVTNPGYGIGVSSTGGFMGVRATNTGTTYSGTSYGLYATATGSSAGTRTAVYGSASGGSTNWAGYFVQNTYVGGDLRVGTLSGANGYKLSVNGKIMCNELRVLATASWPDYVFGESYELMPLSDLESFVNTEKHLPGIPSAAEIDNGQGFEIGEMQRVTVEKLEELTLYLFELKKENDALKARIELLENK